MQAKTKTLWTFAITSVALFMVVLDNLVVSTALPVIRTDLGATIEQLEWTVNAYTLTFAVLLMLGAALGDRFGRRRLFMAGLAVFTAASAAAALSPGIEELIAFRAVQGVGAAVMMPLTLTLIGAAVPAAEGDEDLLDEREDGHAFRLPSRHARAGAARRACRRPRGS